MATADLQTKLDAKRRAVESDRTHRHEEYIDRYRRLLEVMADENSDPDPDEVVEVLDSLGKNTADLTKDTQILLDRRQYASLLPREQRATEQIQTLSDTVADLRRKRAEACRKFDAQIASAESEMATCYDVTQRVATARNKLKQSAWWWLKEREDEIRKVMQSEGEQTQGLRLTVKDQRKQADALENRLAAADKCNAEHGGPYLDDYQKKFYQGSLKKQRQQIKELEERIAARQRESDRLCEELAEIDKEKLKP